MWSIIRKSHRKNFEEKTVQLPHVAGDVGEVRVELFEIADERTEVLSDEHPALFVCQNILNFCQLVILCQKISDLRFVGTARTGGPVKFLSAV